MDDLSELRKFVGVTKAQAKSGRNHLRTLTSMLADLEERLSAIEERLGVEQALAIAQPKEAQRNGSRSSAKVAAV